jgi:hypothetical protein
MDQIKNHPLYRRHNIDSAMSALWEFYKTRFVVLFIISLVMSGILQFAVSVTGVNELSSTSDPAVMLEKFRELILPITLLALVSLFFNTVMHYYVLHAPIREGSVLIDSVWKSAIYFLPYLIIIIILSFVGALAIVLGLIALIVGVFFSITWVAMLSFFILPVMMVEEGSIDVTIMRTVKLAHRNFWPNMGWTAVFIILFLIISIVLSGLALIPFAGSFMSAIANPDETNKLITLPHNPLFLIISAAINALTLPLFPIFAFIVYFNGKAQEDNVNIQTTGGNEEYKVRVEDLYSKPREDIDNVS